jgi:hypothetical protein
MRYTDGGEASESLPRGQRADHLVLGPDGSVYILIDLPELDTRGAGDSSQVLRYTTGLDPFDGFAAEELSGEPLALGVDGAGRAAVWTQNGSEPGSPARGGGNRWDIWRLTAQGVIDTSWSDDGLARIQHPEIGDPEPPGICSKCPPAPPFARLLSLPDGRVIALGYAAEEEFRLFFGSQRRAIARLTDAGDLDPAWDGDGVKILALEDHEEGISLLSSMSQPARQTDGKILVGSVAGVFTKTVERMPAGPEGFASGVTRLTATGADVVPEDTPPPVTPAAAQEQQQQPQQEAPRPCVSRRQFRIRLRKGTRNRKARIVGARVTVNGKAVKITRADRLRSRVNLKRLPKGRYTVRITVKLSNGKTVRETRRYRTCTKKIPHELAPLRGR